MSDRYHQHVGCGGYLDFHHVDSIIKKNRRGKVIKDRRGKPVTIDKTYFKCSKCGKLVNCIIWQSYEELVMTRQLWVSKPEYLRIKQKWKRLEEAKKNAK
ncbi:MAG: hypothetical protein ACLFUH_00925 [Bacteroidales bacterium]